MTIYRTIDGVERAITLTGRELSAAYDEKRAEYERADALSYLDCEGDFIIDNHDISLEQLESLVPDIVSLYHERMDNSEHWWEAVGYAVEDVLHDYDVEHGKEA